MFEKEIALLARAIREAMTKYRAENAVPTRRSVRVRRRDLSLMYVEDFSFPRFALERTEEDIWDWNDQIEFVDSTLKKLPEYDCLVSAVGLAPDHVFSIDNFLRCVASDSFQGLSDEQLNQDVAALARDLGGLPMRVVITAFMDGLSIGESPIVISDALTLRRPLPEDVSESVALDEYGGSHFPSGQTWFRVVGEFSFDTINTGAAQFQFVHMVATLRLFRSGGVSANRYTMTPKNSFRQPGGAAMLYTPGRTSHRVYEISRSDASALKIFLHDITPLVPHPHQSAENTSEKAIACMRYNDALFQEGPPERTITSAVTVLEALFLTNEPELGHRLAQRVSVFLRTLGSQPDATSTYERVSRGYSIRSRFIHGGSPKPKDRPQANELAPVLLEYARGSVLAFLQMETPKAELLKQLDRAMIDPMSLPELERSLASIVHK
jgi:Apea-like HEPN